MINVLEICNNVALASILSIVKRTLLLIQIVVPILLIVYATISLIKLVKNPEEKDGIKKIINQFIAAVIVFFIPLFINVVMNIVGEKSNFSSCWNEADDVIRMAEPVYDDSGRKSINNNATDYEKGHDRGIISTSSPYGEAVACRALDLACSAIGTNYLTAEDAAKVGCTLSGDGRLHVPNVEHSHLYRAELPQTANILKFWDEEKALNLGGLGWYGPASCSPWIGSLLRSMGYDNNIATAVAKNEAPVSPWTGEAITNSISAHGIGTYMYRHPESFDCLAVDSNRSIGEQCLPGDILASPSHILIYTGNELAQKAFPGTTGDAVEAAENGRCYPGVTRVGGGRIGSYKVFRVKKAATNIPESIK